MNGYDKYKKDEDIYIQIDKVLTALNLKNKN